MAISWVIVSQGWRKLTCQGQKSVGKLEISLKLNPMSRVTVDVISWSSVLQYMNPRLNKANKYSTNIDGQICDPWG